MIRALRAAPGCIVAMNETLPKHDIVLLGAGHTHAHVLRMWRMQPIADARLTCVSNFPVATYSGMLPGTLAGQYPPERMCIDLVRLCAAAGVRLLEAEVTGLDLSRRELLLDDRPPLPFDVLSIGIGSVPRTPGVPLDAELVLPIKPMQTFLERLGARLQQVAASRPAGPLRVAVVGAGAGGVEIAFCLPRFVHARLPGVPLELSLVDAHDDILRGAPRGTARAARRQLQRRGVRLLLGHAVRAAADGHLLLCDGSRQQVDLVLWATSATAPPLLRRLGLATDEDGFLLVRSTLQSLEHDHIFAVGDTATLSDCPTPKAGVYAVRQGPVLWDNLQRFVRGEALQAYRPQRGFLSLLNLGDGRAILSYKGVTLTGRWCWRLKNRIDSRFMDKYQDYRPRWETGALAMAPSSPTHAMRCAGCGGKVGGSVLSKVLRRLEIPPSPHVVLGLEQPDDAAIIQPPGGRPVVCTADFFAAFLDDPYLVGRVAALNSASDLFAMGSQPLAALALATIPLGPPRKQEQLLYELLAGGLLEFRRMGATLIGGHTIEGPQTTIGYAMLADAGTRPPLGKAGLRPGDTLILTKPLGSGVLLAAHMQARCTAAWMSALRRVLLASNQPPAEAARQFDVRAMTDVTGFGLAGHLLEMLRAGDVAAELDLAALPLLPGAEELAASGWESTLAPANRSAEADIDAPYALQRLPRYALLFDPQTSGGLLLGVRPEHADALLRRLGELSDVPCAIIGQVTEAHEGQPRLRVLGKP
jgi:selenide,water dikinase